MKSMFRYSAIPVGLMISVFAITVGLVSFVLMTHVSAADGGNHKGRLVTIYDRDKEHVILTNAATIQGALDEAHIALDPKDTVEPAPSEALVANSYHVNIYRARPVIVVDGATREKIMTPYQTADKIAADAGLALHDEDKTTLQPTQDIVADGASLELKIDRATPFTLGLYGTDTPSYTQAKTVKDMLKEKNITLGTQDTLSVSLDAPIVPDMTVEIWRNGAQTITENQVIPFATQKINDADQPVGYHEVQTPGVNGTKAVTYEIVMKNGQEVSRTQIQSVVVTDAKDQIEVIGTKYVLPPGSHTDWMDAAGISSGDYGFVEYIVSHEGGWCPVRWQGDAGCINHGSAPSGLGYGIVQATPGSKMASAGSDWLTNPITQLRWATSYAVGRYGSWSNAYNHWTSHHNW